MSKPDPKPPAPKPSPPTKFYRLFRGKGREAHAYLGVECCEVVDGKATVRVVREPDVTGVAMGWLDRLVREGVE